MTDILVVVSGESRLMVETVSLPPPPLGVRKENAEAAGGGCAAGVSSGRGGTDDTVDCIKLKAEVAVVGGAGVGASGASLSSLEGGELRKPKALLVAAGGGAS